MVILVRLAPRVYSIEATSWRLQNSDPLDYDAWDGYQANRNRTFQHLYDNKIDNNIVISGDSHLSWVSDLVWLDDKSYDPATGAGSIGVEFRRICGLKPLPLRPEHHYGEC